MNVNCEEKNKTETAVQSQDDEKNYMTDKTYKKTYLII